MEIAFLSATAGLSVAIIVATALTLVGAGLGWIACTLIMLAVIIISVPVSALFIALTFTLGELIE